MIPFVDALSRLKPPLNNRRSTAGMITELTTLTQFTSTFVTMEISHGALASARTGLCSVFSERDTIASGEVTRHKPLKLNPNQTGRCSRSGNKKSTSNTESTRNSGDAISTVARLRLFLLQVPECRVCTENFGDKSFPKQAFQNVSLRDRLAWD